MKCFDFSPAEQFNIMKYGIYLREIFDLLLDTVVSEFSKELNSQQAVQWHEEQEENHNILDLLARSSEIQ